MLALFEKRRAVLHGTFIVELQGERHAVLHGLPVTPAISFKLDVAIGIVLGRLLYESAMSMCGLSIVKLDDRVYVVLTKD